MMVMMTVVGLGRSRTVLSRHSSRKLMVMVMVVMLVVAHKWTEWFFHQLMLQCVCRCRRQCHRRRQRRRHRSVDVVLRLKLAVFAAGSAVKIRRPRSGCGRGRRVLISVGNGRDVWQSAVGVCAGRGRLQHSGRERRIRVNRVRPRHSDPLPFVLHSSILKPYLKRIIYLLL